MLNFEDSIKMVTEAMREERKLVSEELYNMQKGVTMFPTVEECTAYNQALRDAAEAIIEGVVE
jgi:hypothetical protein